MSDASSTASAHWSCVAGAVPSGQTLGAPPSHVVSHMPGVDGGGGDGAGGGGDGWGGGGDGGGSAGGAEGGGDDGGGDGPSRGSPAQRWFSTATGASRASNTLFSMLVALTNSYNLFAASSSGV